MRRISWLLMLLLTACASGPPRTPQPVSITTAEISGVVQGEQRLSGEVILAGDLLVPEGSRLVIAAGTVVTVRPADATKIDPEFLSSQTELLVRGSLQIEGTADAPVVFSLEQSDDASATWAGIALDRAHDSALRHVWLNDADTGVLLVDSDALVEHLDIRRCRYGLVVQSGTPKIHDATVSEGEGGVFLWEGAQPRIERLTIHDNAEEGLFIDPSSRPQLRDVISANNAIGVVASRQFDLASVALQGNGQDVRRLPVGLGGQP